MVERKNADILRMLTDELGIKFHCAAPLMRDLEILGAEYLQLLKRELNVSCTRSARKMDEDRREQLEIAAHLTLKAISSKLKLLINTDARSNPFGIVLPSGRSNNFGGMDWRLDV
jgi:hypothetical protein